ncbi:MAG: hypothetical protein WC551_09510 [Patescibacteria group bacterium]
MTVRPPHPHSETEIRRALQRLSVDSDDQSSAILVLQSDVDDLETDVSAIDIRVDVLEAASDGRCEAEAAEVIAAGIPVYGVAGLANVGLARADTAAKARVAGLAVQAAGVGFTCVYAAGGRVTLADWTAVAGAAALSPSSTYYLGATGGITTVATTTVGQSVTEIGYAEDGTTLILNIKRPVLL